MNSHISFMSTEFRQFGATGKTQVKAQGFERGEGELEEKYSA